MVLLFNCRVWLSFNPIIDVTATRALDALYSMLVVSVRRTKPVLIATTFSIDAAGRAL